MTPSVYLAALHILPGINQEFLRRGMIVAQGDAEAFWYQLTSIAKKLGFHDVSFEKLQSAAQKLDVNAISQRLYEQKIQVLTENDPEFPFDQNDVMEDVPFMVYIKGEVAVLAQDKIAVVGARRITPYGEQVVQSLIPFLVQGGFGITSGLAKGIDGMAHTQTLHCKGNTLAIVGTGIDQVYPRTHRELEQRIIHNHGCILSEFPLGTQPLRWNFPLRNRIIARLAKAVIVVEAGTASGSIRTAEWASEYNKRVYVVPGSIFSAESLGCNELLAQKKETIHVLSKLEDILECTAQSSLQLRGTIQYKQIPENLHPMLKLLGDTPLSVSDLAEKSGLSLSISLSLLAQLEVYDAASEYKNGWIRKVIHLTS